jgi:hypothetical protein
LGSDTEAFAWYGGVSDLSANPATNGKWMMTLDSAGLTVNGTFVSSSDRNVKENIQPIGSREVLEKLTSLPITAWSYKRDSATRHVGPMAQDFYAAFGFGPDDKHIATVDADGVAFAAIQGLNQKLEERLALEERALRAKDKEIKDLKHRLERLEALIGNKPGE